MRTTIAIAAAMSLIWSIALAGAAGLPGRDNPAGVDKPAVPAPTDDGQALSQDDMVKYCKDAQIVFLANVKAIEHGQTNSMPPHVFSAITFQDVTMLKGAQPQRLSFSFTNVPGSAGVTTDSSVIAATKDNALVCVALASDENVAAVKKALGESATQPAGGDEYYRRLYTQYKAAILKAAQSGDADEVAKLTQKFNESVGGIILQVTISKVESGKWTVVFSKHFGDKDMKLPAIKYANMDEIHVSTQEGYVLIESPNVGGKGDEGIYITLAVKPAPPATQPATVNDRGIKTLKEAQRIVEAELAKPKSTYGTRAELTARLKAIQDQIVKLEAEPKVPAIGTTPPATQPTDSTAYDPERFKQANLVMRVRKDSASGIANHGRDVGDYATILQILKHGGTGSVVGNNLAIYHKADGAGLPEEECTVYIKLWYETTAVTTGSVTSKTTFWLHLLGDDAKTGVSHVGPGAATRPAAQGAIKHVTHYAYWLTNKDLGEYVDLLIAGAPILQRPVGKFDATKALRDADAILVRTYAKDSIWNVDRVPFKRIESVGEVDFDKQSVVVNGMSYRYTQASLREVVALLENPEGNTRIHRRYAPLNGGEDFAKVLLADFKTQLEGDKSSGPATQPATAPARAVVPPELYPN